MADKRMQMVLAFVLVAALCGGSMAQPSSSCTNVIISMSPCLNYITGNSFTPLFFLLYMQWGQVTATVPV